MSKMQAKEKYLSNTAKDLNVKFSSLPEAVEKEVKEPKVLPPEIQELDDDTREKLAQLQGLDPENSHKTLGVQWRKAKKTAKDALRIKDDKKRQKQFETATSMFTSLIDQLDKAIEVRQDLEKKCTTLDEEANDKLGQLFGLDPAEFTGLVEEVSQAVGHFSDKEFTAAHKQYTAALKKIDLKSKDLDKQTTKQDTQFKEKTAQPAWELLSAAVAKELDALENLPGIDDQATPLRQGFQGAKNQAGLKKFDTACNDLKKIQSDIRLIRKKIEEAIGKLPPGVKKSRDKLAGLLKRLEPLVSEDDSAVFKNQVNSLMEKALQGDDVAKDLEIKVTYYTDLIPKRKKLRSEAEKAAKQAQLVLNAYLLLGPPKGEYSPYSARNTKAQAHLDEFSFNKATVEFKKLTDEVGKKEQEVRQAQEKWVLDGKPALENMNEELKKLELAANEARPVKLAREAWATVKALADRHEFEDARTELVDAQKLLKEAQEALKDHEALSLLLSQFTQEFFRLENKFKEELQPLRDKLQQIAKENPNPNLPPEKAGQDLGSVELKLKDMEAAWLLCRKAPYKSHDEANIGLTKGLEEAKANFAKLKTRLLGDKEKKIVGLIDKDDTLKTMVKDEGKRNKDRELQAAWMKKRNEVRDQLKILEGLGADQFTALQNKFDQVSKNADLGNVKGKEKAIQEIDDVLQAIKDRITEQTKANEELKRKCDQARAAKKKLLKRVGKLGKGSVNVVKDLVMDQGLDTWRHDLRERINNLEKAFDSGNGAVLQAALDELKEAEEEIQKAETNPKVAQGFIKLHQNLNRAKLWFKNKDNKKVMPSTVAALAKEFAGINQSLKGKSMDDDSWWVPIWEPFRLKWVEANERLPQVKKLRSDFLAIWGELNEGLLKLAKERKQQGKTALYVKNLRKEGKNLRDQAKKVEDLNSLKELIKKAKVLKERTEEIAYQPILLEQGEKSAQASVELQEKELEAWKVTYQQFLDTDLKKAEKAVEEKKQTGDKSQIKTLKSFAKKANKAATKEHNFDQARQLLERAKRMAERAEKWPEGVKATGKKRLQELIPKWKKAVDQVREGINKLVETIETRCQEAEDPTTLDPMVQKLKKVNLAKQVKGFKKNIFDRPLGLLLLKEVPKAEKKKNREYALGIVRRYQKDLDSNPILEHVRTNNPYYRKTGLITLDTVLNDMALNFVRGV